MATDDHSSLVPLDVDRPIWERFFSVAPLVVVGTREPDGNYDLAPKHMAGPFSWENHFGFVCTPRHATYRNAERERAFAVSYPRPEQVVLAGLAASPRCEDQSKPTIGALPTIPGRSIDAPLLRGSYLCLECTLDRIVDGLGPNSLIVGKIIAAGVHPEALRGVDRDDQEVIAGVPLLAYLHPGRFAAIDHSNSFPLPAGLSR